MGILLGSTRNISDRGLLADFGEPVLPGTTGRVSLRVGRCTVEIQARVTNSEGFSAGMEFEFASEQERSFLHAVVQMLSEVRESESTQG